MVRFYLMKILTLLMSALVFFFIMNETSSGGDEPADSVINFEVIVPTDSFTVGDDITVHILVDYPSGVKLSPPSSLVGDGVFVLKSGPQIKSKTRNGRKYDDFTYVISAFETGNLEIPAFEFFWYDSEGTQHSAFSPKKSIFIKSLLPADTSGLDINDIIGPKRLPRHWWPYLIAGLGVLTLFLVAYLLYQRKVSSIEIPHAPAEPPYDVAIRELILLKEKNLPAKGKIKRYYIELSNIIRHYINGRFAIQAVEATTPELKRMILRHPELDKEKATEILTFLNRSDMVKFAKFVPNPHLPDEDYELVRNFVVATKPVEVAEKMAI